MRDTVPPYYDPHLPLEQLRAANRQALGLGADPFSAAALVSAGVQRAQEAAERVAQPRKPTAPVVLAKESLWQRAKPILVLGGIGLAAWWFLSPKPQRKRR